MIGSRWFGMRLKAGFLEALKVSGARKLRFASVALGVSVLALGWIASPQVGLAEAIVLGTRKYDAPSRPEAEINGLKAQYRRPAFIPFPDDNRYTPEKAALGKRLFFDPRLSATGSQSCSSCHNPGFGWQDGLAVGVGESRQQLDRRSSTVVNAAWGSIFMWDGRARDLEEQALGPIESATEMNMSIEELLDRLSTIPEYESLFAAAFPADGISANSLTAALATYERTIVSDWAPFDSWIKGDEDAILDAAKRGFVIFNTKAGCASCHVGWNFTDDSFHDIGLPTQDVGRGKLLPSVVKMKHAFKTPGLREITRRAPYMHNGSLATLAEVIDHYDQGGIARPSRSDLMAPLGLSDADKSDLVEFLKTLSGKNNSTPVPALPR